MKKVNPYQRGLGLGKREKRKGKGGPFEELKALNWRKNSVAVVFGKVKVLGTRDGIT